MSKCEYCKKEFEGNKKARFCSAKCRVYWNRNNEKGKIVTDPLLYDLEHKSLEQLETEGYWIPNWRRKFKTKEAADTSLMRVIEQMPGKYFFKGYEIDTR